MEQHSDQGIRGLRPFTDFAFLREGFTEGHRWKISVDGIQRLQDSSLITLERARIFRRDGATGSYLEILERNDGYRGFNKSGIIEIIRRTDPRGNANPG